MPKAHSTRLLELAIPSYNNSVFVVIAGSHLGAVEESLRAQIKAAHLLVMNVRFVTHDGPGVSRQVVKIVQELGLTGPVIYKTDYDGALLSARVSASGTQDTQLSDWVQATRLRAGATGTDPLATSLRNSCLLAFHGPRCPLGHAAHAQTDLVIAFMSEDSVGTRDLVHKALRAGIPVQVHDLEGKLLDQCPCATPEDAHVS